MFPPEDVQAYFLTAYQDPQLLVTIQKLVRLRAFQKGDSPHLDWIIETYKRYFSEGYTELHPFVLGMVSKAFSFFMKDYNETYQQWKSEQEARKNPYTSVDELYDALVIASETIFQDLNAPAFAVSGYQVLKMFANQYFTLYREAPRAAVTGMVAAEILAVGSQALEDARVLLELVPQGRFKDIAQEIGDSHAPDPSQDV